MFAKLEATSAPGAPSRPFRSRRRNVDGGIIAGTSAGKTAREIRDLLCIGVPTFFRVWDNVIGRAWKRSAITC